MLSSQNKGKYVLGIFLSVNNVDNKVYNFVILSLISQEITYRV